VEQNYLSRGDASGNYFTERELNPRYQHDAELIYTAYDGVAPIVKAAAEALVRARRERREQQRASSVVIDPDAYCFGGGLAAVTQYGNPAGSCCACGKVVRVSKNGKAPRHKPLILSSTREAS
jgi:hypothetical protein